MAVIPNYLRCKVTGEACMRFFNLCKNNGFRLSHLVPDGDGFQMDIAMEDFRKLRPLIRKTHVKIHIMNRHGPAFFFYRHRYRFWFFGGLAVCAALIWYMSLFVWQIDIRGNRMYTNDLILQSLRTMGVETGCKKSDLSLPAIEEELRIMYNQMTWVSASMTGTKLLIELKEGNLQSFGDKDDTATEDMPSNLTAASDATITSVVVRRGTASVKPGDTVLSGDVLVEGKVYIYNDDETLKKVDYTCADADIMADYETYYQKDYERQYETRVYTGQAHTAYTFRFGKYSLSLPDFYEPPEAYEKWTWQKQFRLTPTFYLPFSIFFTEYLPYEMKTASYTDAMLRKKAEDDLENYLDELVKKGVQIIGNSVTIALDADGCHASGTLSLNGPIGTVTPIDSSNMALND